MGVTTLRPVAGRTVPHRGARRARHWRVRLPRTLSLLCWLVLAPLAALALARLVAWDGDVLLAEANSLNGLAYVPAWPVLLLAALGRRAVLGGAAALVIVAQLAFAAPEVLAARPLPTWARHAPTIRVFDANVGSDAGNDNMSGFAQTITRHAPDLVTLEEIDPQDFAQLESDGALAPFRYRAYERGRLPWGFGIASRFPLRIEHVLMGGGNPFLVVARLRLAHRILRVWIVHTQAPVASLVQWRSDLEAIAARARTRGLRRLLVVGDFNASWGNAGFNAVLDSGLVDAAAARGEPFAMTWPESRLLPPLVRIDHFLSGSEVALSKIRTLVGPGSDHRALVGEVAISGPAIAPRTGRDRRAVRTR